MWQAEGSDARRTLTLWLVLVAERFAAVAAVVVVDCMVVVVVVEC